MSVMGGVKRAGGNGKKRVGGRRDANGTGEREKSTFICPERR